MDKLITLNTKTVGRDKLARLFQYACKTCWYLLQTNQLGTYETREQFKNVENQLSTFRKLLRFGRFIDQLKQALSNMKIDNEVIRYTATLSSVSNSIFLFCDHVIWLKRAGISDINTLKWSTISNKYWLYSILLNLIKNVYQIREIYLRKSSFYHVKKELLGSNKLLLLETIKNSCDVIIPLHLLGYFKSSEGFVGFCGVISSIAALAVL